MTSCPPGLASQLVQLRASATPAEAGSGTVSAALHALIAATFARIFARLEQLLALWQSGHLPPPASRATTRPTATTPDFSLPKPTRRGTGHAYTRVRFPVIQSEAKDPGVRAARRAPHRKPGPHVILRARRAHATLTSHFAARAPPAPRHFCRVSPSTRNVDLRSN